MPVPHSALSHGSITRSLLKRLESSAWLLLDHARLTSSAPTTSWAIVGRRQAPPDPAVASLNYITPNLGSRKVTKVHAHTHSLDGRTQEKVPRADYQICFGEMSVGFLTRAGHVETAGSFIHERGSSSCCVTLVESFTGDTPVRRKCSARRCVYARRHTLKINADPSHIFFP